MLAESLLHRSYFAGAKKSSTIIQMQGHPGSRLDSNFAFNFFFFFKINLTSLQELAAVTDAQVHRLGVVTMVICQVSGSQHSKGNLEVKEQALTLP